MVTERGLVPSPENEKRLALSQASFRAGNGTIIEPILTISELCICLVFRWI